MSIYNYLMLRSKGGIDRLKQMLSINLDGNATLALSSGQLQAIENSNLLRLGEKIELVLVSMGYKLTTEIFESITYHQDEHANMDISDDIPLSRLHDLFSQLPFPYFEDRLRKPDRKTGIMKEYTWLQVSVNERVNYFMQHFADTLTEMEDGILYGYPNSAIRAFARLIDVTEKVPTSIERYYVGAGRPSVRFYEAEEAYYRQIWQELSEVSPRLVHAATKNMTKGIRLGKLYFP